MILESTVDARIAETMDSIVVTPRNPRQALPLLSALRSAVPAGAVRRTVAGITIDGFEAHRLFEDNVKFDVRASTDVRRFAENRKKAAQIHQNIVEQVRSLRVGGVTTAKTIIENHRTLAGLDDHQIVDVAAMTLPGSYGLCLFDEQGAGKTVTLIYAYDTLVARDEVDFALIIAPKSMVPEWPRDFHRFKGDLYTVAIASGSRAEKISAISKSPEVLVTNFETAISMEAELRALLRRYNGRAMLAVDESFYVKNLDAQRTRSIRRLREWCTRAYVLCGTPSPNSVQDIVEQFNTVDFGLTFRGIRYSADASQTHSVIQRAIEQNGAFLRHLKHNVLPGLPERRHQKLLLPLQPEQERLYKNALTKLVVDVQATDEKSYRRNLTSFLARRIALLQICSNPAAVSEAYKEVPSKLLALDTLLADLIGAKKEKVIVWSFFTHSIDTIFSRYQKYNPVRYDGAVADVNERRRAVSRFQEDDETMLFVANPAAAGAGLTLHRSRIAIYESFSNQAAHYLQSLDRIHRRGQTRKVEYLFLLCDETIECQEYSRLLTKQGNSQKLLGDSVPSQLTREVFLRELTEAAKLVHIEI